MSPQFEEARRFLRLARRDHGTFTLLLSLPQADLAALGFHAQQSAEKALKAVIVMTGIAVPRTHDLAALGVALQLKGVNLPLSLDDLRLLNPFAVEFRYDDEMVPAVPRDFLAHLLETLMRWAIEAIETQ
jgi:HEPN domain-containing protein